MILHASAGGPWWITVGASLILILHIGAGGIAIVSGMAALAFRKGGRGHRIAGNLFFVSMLIMSAIGASVAAFLPSRISVIAGALTFYLVATSWVTVRHKPGDTGRFEMAAFLFASGIAAAGLAIGVQTVASPTGRLDGLPPQPVLVFAAVAALAAVSDLRMIRRPGIFGAQRIARHLWRMCAALLIAAFSFFLGQQKVMPVSMRGSPLLFVPELIIIGSMIFWLVRVRFARRFRQVAV
ncbi:MAG: hypothetical protein JWN66_1078 [Sphingomonas bacterium]|uniref:hypothetical protein n=1 Tax=Sphingomonas bacterium TaxID=1895847 RepID=UPI00262CCB13|nr:hypothetical protein [Sphingomonas bacterium]MDB5703962.1 hypothetical protein [Sphingomonas bacterium]